MAKLIFGCGYLGGRVARRWRDGGEQVFVVTRNAERASQFEDQGYRPIVADVTRPESLAGLPIVDTVLYAVGHDRQSCASIHEVYVEGLRAALDALPAATGKLVYASSTGVYAQSDGEWVDEDSPCAPQRAGGQACLAAEELLTAHPLGSRAIVLRLAGLYGPGRIPSAADIRANRPFGAPGDGYLNLIHVDDAAAIVVMAGQRAQPPRTYTVSDGHPVERRKYYAELARLLGANPPRFSTAPADLPAILRAASNKRVANARMMAELDIVLQFPSYREALAAIVAAEQSETPSR